MQVVKMALSVRKAGLLRVTYPRCERLYRNHSQLIITRLSSKKTSGVHWESCENLKENKMCKIIMWADAVYDSLGGTIKPCTHKMRHNKEYTL